MNYTYLTPKKKRLQIDSLLPVSNPVYVLRNSVIVNVNYEPINLMTVARINKVAKKPNETMKPTPESTASLRFVCTLFSNSFILTPPTHQTHLLNVNNL